ncbi:hypothetical protein MIND_01419800 [Mycena indigotica]|uniref:Uncharacterized protein n=1 Tax=Mycena indigotica TaxID=2126181 RepID=A0A8H6RZY6_9AGAR|nr:uncharacterized protein MIND_01419800 [Mycena indigotica]KAF7288745.1 hypothetical protein MIND_01419800 [Mycena indigotica]
MSSTSTFRPKQPPPPGQIVLSLTQKSSLPPFPPDIGFTSPTKRVLSTQIFPPSGFPALFHLFFLPLPDSSGFAIDIKDPLVESKATNRLGGERRSSGVGWRRSCRGRRKDRGECGLERANERRGTLAYCKRLATYPISPSTHSSHSSNQNSAPKLESIVPQSPFSKKSHNTTPIEPHLCPHTPHPY